MLLTAEARVVIYNRAAALLCAEMGIQMRLVSYTDNPSDYENSLNYYVANLAGVEHIYCTKTEVAETIQKLIVEMKENAVSFRYCYGGGKSLKVYMLIMMRFVS